jgi:hypothetical protein
VKAAAAAAVVALLGAAVASSAGSAARVIERTLLCNVPTQSGSPDPFRELRISVSPKRKGGWPPTAAAFTLNAPEGNDFSVGFTTGPTPRNRTGYIAWTRPPSCTATSRRVAFSTAGLQGGPAPFGKEVKCDPPARVVIHVRAVFAKPVTVGTDPRVPSQLFAKGTISKGQLAVAAPRGKRLAYATADGATGKVTLFAAKFPLCS